MSTIAAPEQVLEANPWREMIARMTIAHATDLWLGELERKNESPRTIDTYRRLLYKLADAYPHIDVDELTATQIRRFLDSQSRKADGTRKADRTLAQQISILNGFMDWLAGESVIKHNPIRRNGLRILQRPRLAPAEENDAVVTVTGAGVVKLLETADKSGKWNRRLAVNCLVYLGPRRRAIAQARLSDYDPVSRTLAFMEKGRKTIRKPVPDQLADLIDAAIAGGVYKATNDYLVPGNAEQRRRGQRDDRVIWRLVREVAADAGVTTHVHALRAAFAVRFLEQNPEQIVALKDLMGHRRVETTLVYLRRLNRMRSMDVVRDLDWSTPKLLEAKRVTEKEGFEPSLGATPALERAGSQPDASAPGSYGPVSSELADVLLARARKVLDREAERA